jgi:hypothetical protein
MSTTHAPTTTPEEDIARWDLPAEQAEHSAFVAAKLGYDMCLVPFFLPGKTFGIWTVGQEVEIAPSTVGFCMNNNFDGNDVREVACNWARDHMAKGRKGTWGFFVVRADGPHHATTPAFEDIMSWDQD